MDTYQHVRAELQRVARQVRRLRGYVEGKRQKPSLTCLYVKALDDVLDIIREAKR